MKKGNIYKFTIDYKEDMKGNKIENESLSFETKTHEDIFKLIDIMKEKSTLSENDATAFIVGLKLFSGVMLENNDKEIFKEFLPYFKDFMKKVKTEKF